MLVTFPVILSDELSRKQKLKQKRESYLQVRKHIGNSAVELYLSLGQLCYEVSTEVQKHLRELFHKAVSVTKVSILYPFDVGHHYSRQKILLCISLIPAQLI